MDTTRATHSSGRRGADGRGAAVGVALLAVLVGLAGCIPAERRSGADAGASPSDAGAPGDTGRADTAPTDTADTAAAADTASVDATDTSADTGADTGAGIDGDTQAGDADAATDVWLHGDGWTNVAFGAVGQTATFAYDLRAQADAINGVAGITLGRAGAYTDVAMIVRLNADGAIDVRDGDGYAADVSLPYTAGVVYHVVITADFASHTYDVTVTEAGGVPVTLRSGAAFRTESVIDRADHLSFMEPDDRLEVGNLRVNGQPVDMVVEPEPTPSGGLWHLGFANSPVGAYTESQIEADWQGVQWASPQGRAEIVETSGERFLRIHYPAGGVGPGEGGAQWRVDLDGVLGQTYDELYVAYRVRFRSGFDFVRGGKLPGLLGGEGNTGGNAPDGTDGWSGRMMWRPEGRAVQYLYHPDQSGTYGEDLAWDLGTERRFPPGSWVTVEHRIVMNTPGQRDGIVQGWWNGQLALDRRDIRFRDVSSFAVDGFYFSTFFGGSGADWAPTRDEYVDFDDFVYSDRPITH